MTKPSKEAVAVVAPTTKAGRALLVSLAAFPQGPGSAIFGQDCRNRIAAIEAEAVEQWREALTAPVCNDEDDDGFCDVHFEVGNPCEDEDRARLDRLRALLAKSESER